MGQVNQSIKSFFRNKSIQKTDQFILTIDPPPEVSVQKDSKIERIKKQVNDLLGPQPPIENWHIRNFVLPNFNFTKEQFPAGTFVKSFPSLNYEGFDFTITIEEDNIGSVARFAHWCQRRIVDDRGFHLPQILNKIGNMRLDILDELNQTICRFNFEDSFYLEAAPVSYDYSQSTQTLWTFTFHSDFLTFWSHG